MIVSYREAAAFTMRPSLPLLVRVLTRQELKAEAASTVTARPLPGPLRSERVVKPTLIQELLAQKKHMGDKYPSNIRIEPILQRHFLKNVDPEARKEILELMKEK